MKIMFGGDLKFKIFAIRKNDLANKMIVCNLLKILLVLFFDFFSERLKKMCGGSGYSLIKSSHNISSIRMPRTCHLP